MGTVPSRRGEGPSGAGDRGGPPFQAGFPRRGATWRAGAASCALGRGGWAANSLPREVAASAADRTDMPTTECRGRGEPCRKSRRLPKQGNFVGASGSAFAATGARARIAGFSRGGCWSGRWESNPRHSAWEADVLPLNYARSPPSIGGACRVGQATPKGVGGGRAASHRPAPRPAAASGCRLQDLRPPPPLDRRPPPGVTTGSAETPLAICPASLRRGSFGVPINAAQRRGGGKQAR